VGKRACLLQGLWSIVYYVENENIKFEKHESSQLCITASHLTNPQPVTYQILIAYFSYKKVAAANGKMFVLG